MSFIRVDSGIENWIKSGVRPCFKNWSAFSLRKTVRIKYKNIIVRLRMYNSAEYNLGINIFLDRKKIEKKIVCN